jgi:hypothetical protein
MSYCLHIYASFSPIRSPIWTTEICLWPAPLGRNTSYCKFFKIKIQENLLKGTNGKSEVRTIILILKILVKDY